MSCGHGVPDCGCCRPPGTVASVANTPGLPSVSRGVGTSGRFEATMAAALTGKDGLERFSSRRTDDPAMALVDAWSAVLDVLGFYSDRVANEAFVRTASDPRSLSELAHSVGYVPGRGRASATSLAFTLEDATGSPEVVPIPKGTRVASLPAPGEVPQTYETTSDLVSRPAWNAIRARTRVPQALGVGARGAYVEGARTDLGVGDAVLLVGSEREGAGASASWAFRRLARVQVLPELDATRIGWTDPLGTPPAGSGREGDERVPAARDQRLYVLRRQAAVFGASAPDHRLINVSAGGGRADPVPRLTRAFAAIDAPDTAKESGRFTGTELRAAAGPDWPGFSVRVPGQPENTIDLDATYPVAVPGSWAVLTRPGVTVCYQVLTATEQSRTDFTLNAKVTRLTVKGPTVSHLFGAHVRETSAWVGSELVSLATSPDPLPVQGSEIPLERPVPTLEAGRTLVVRGPRPAVRVAERVRGLELKRPSGPPVALHPGDLLEVVGPVASNADGSMTWVTSTGTVTAGTDALEHVPPVDGARVWSETAVVDAPTPDDPEVDTIRLAAPLAGCYDGGAVRVLANVAPATHGEATTQVLGSGDAARTYQRFRLAKVPLTYVAGGSGGAVVSTLEVRVDGRRWTEVPQLFGSGPDDEVYATEQDDEGTVTVLFGDGRTGARVPTGANNVTATYRVGTGVAGRLPAGRLTLPMTRPLGLRSVTNPLETGLAADPESPAEVRANTPRTALALERVVSLRDVEDFARTVPGIGKALATWLWDGRTRLVHLTVAGTSGQTVDDRAVRDLRAAVLAAGDPRLPLRVAVADVVPVHVSVGVVVDPARDTQGVLDAVAASLATALSVDARALAQPLTTGDIILATHAVPGAVAANVVVPSDDVPASPARVSGTVVEPAQVVALAPGGLTVTGATP